MEELLDFKRIYQIELNENKLSKKNICCSKGQKKKASKSKALQAEE